MVPKVQVETGPTGPVATALIRYNISDLGSTLPGGVESLWVQRLSPESYLNAVLLLSLLLQLLLVLRHLGPLQQPEALLSGELNGLGAGFGGQEPQGLSHERGEQETGGCCHISIVLCYR